MKSDAVSNEVLRLKFNHHNFGEANCPFNDDRFANEIAKSPPPDFPSSEEWRSAAASQPRTRDYTKEPSTPSGLVARWRVFPNRDDARDNRDVPLAKGQTAKLVVHLPEGPREQFRFNLKHDKHNATDRGRTARVGHGDAVAGDAHDWSSFGRRIYLGERDGSDQHGFEVAPTCFFVDLILNEEKRVENAPAPRDYSVPPPEPAGLIARWHVLPGRIDTRDNRDVPLPKGRTAKLVVHLPEGPRERFRFNLKHDKHNATDRGRTARIGHGDTVSGDAHDWPAFGKRIYLGERDGSDQSGFDVSSNGFYVDLVLVR